MRAEEAEKDTHPDSSPALFFGARYVFLFFSPSLSVPVGVSRVSFIAHHHSTRRCQSCLTLWLSAV